MEVLSTALDLSHMCTCSEPCVTNTRYLQVILIVTFILSTFDLITNWINWKQWSDVGGYDQHRIVYIFTTAFLCVALFGTVLWIIETICIVVKLFCIHRTKKIQVENPTDLTDESEEKVRK